MIKFFFHTFFTIISSLANIILTPINSLVMNNFPDIAILINNFNSFLNTYLVANLGFFGSLLPPITKGIILFYLAYLGIRFLVVLNVHLILKVFHLIKNLKIW